MAEQFCLKWNNHQSTLISNFDSLLGSQKHVDCSLSAEGRILNAHKVVLSACSPYLEELLNHERDKYPVLVFSDVKYDYLRAMLDYMYRGEVNVLQEHLNGFLKAAETLQIKGLADQGGGGDSKRKQPSRVESPIGHDRSSSPTVPAKRRRQRRPSQDLSDGLADTTSNSCDIPNVAPPLPPVLTKQPKVETDRVSSNPPILSPAPLPPSNPANVQPKLEPVETPPVQPKTEYIEDVNDEQIEDLTLDDDDDDSYMAVKPGSSHGNDSQGFDPSWQFSGETSNPDMFMGTQDPIGNQNNSQDVCWDDYISVIENGEDQTSRVSKFFEETMDNTRGKILKCRMCPYIAKFLCRMKVHINSSHDPNPILYRCNICGYTARVKGIVKEHMNVKHDPFGKKYCCPHCSYTTKSKGSFKGHLVRQHSTLLKSTS